MNYITTRTKIVNNYAYTSGGGIFISITSSVVISDSLIHGNSAVYAGAGMHIYGNTIEGEGPSIIYLKRVFVEQNNVTQNKLYVGHGTTVIANGGGGIYMEFNSVLLSRESLLFDNFATNNQGHQIMTVNGTYGTPSITLINTKFVQGTNTSNVYGYDSSKQIAGIEQFIPPTTCTPTLCNSNGYTNPICVNKPNPNEGVTCFVGCQPGKYGANVSACHDCPTGTYGTKAGIILKSEACSSCAVGRYNPSTGQTSCLLICPGGRYGNVIRASSVDEGCPNTCPLGRYGHATGKTTLAEACSSVCEPGKYGSRLGQNSESDCLVCPNGYFCERDGLKTPCSLGKYGISSQNASYKAKEYENNVCQACPASKYGVLAGQSKLRDACMGCPAGRFSLTIGLKNDTNNVKDYCPKSCGVGFYLDSTLEDNQCTRCPHGAFCPDATDALGMVAKAGYWRVPNTTRFIACLNPCACLGAFNDGIVCKEKVFLNDAEEGCNVDKGFEAGSVLCANCQPGYSRDGAAGCKSCYKGELKLLFPVLVAVLILLLLLFFIWSTVVKRGGAFRVSDGAKKIFVSFLQLAALASTMNIPWPEGYFELFKMQSMVSSVGEEYIDMRCSWSEPVSIAQIQYIKTMGYALTPVVLVLLSVVGWCICGRRYPAEKRNAMRTGTIVLVLYFVWPAITSNILQLWKCYDFGEGVGEVFLIDPETKCTDSTHLLWRNLLGWPCVLVYILGLPIAAMYALYRYRKKLDESLTQVRFGMLYDGFSRNNYMHEFWVALRKLLIIYIGIFSDKLQVLLAIGVVGMLLVHTVMVQPFHSKSLSLLEIMLLSCCFVTLWIGGVFVVYPECQSKDSSIRNMCKIGEAFVLVINILCFLVGFCVYIWLAWMERREQMAGRAKKICAQLATWKVFQSCCQKGFGRWLRESQLEWKTNPLDAEQVDIEMTQPQSVLEGMARSVLESKYKLEIKTLKEEVEKLKAAVNALTFYKKGKRKKNMNSWRKST